MNKFKRKLKKHHLKGYRAYRLNVKGWSVHLNDKGMVMGFPKAKVLGYAPTTVSGDEHPSETEGVWGLDLDDLMVGESYYNDAWGSLTLERIEGDIYYFTRDKIDIDSKSAMPITFKLTRTEIENNPFIEINSGYLSVSGIIPGERYFTYNGDIVRINHLAIEDIRGEGVDPAQYPFVGKDTKGNVIGY